MRRTTLLFAILLVLLSLPPEVAADPVPSRAMTSIQVLEVNLKDIEPHRDELVLARDDGKVKVAARVGDLGVLYSDDRGREELSRLGISFEVLIEDVGDTGLYLVTKSADLAGARVEDYSDVLSERDSYYLVCPDPQDAPRLYFLPAKVRLPSASDTGLPFAFARPAPDMSGPRPLIYSPALQAMVDSVSESRLHSWVSGLSGEHSVTVGGEPYTILTRWPLVPMATIAARYLREQFESLGLETEYAYTGLLSALRAVDFPLDGMRGWAVGGECAIIHTEDGGGLWSEQRFSGLIAYYDVSMFDPTRGIVVGEDGTILATTDGQTWNEAAPITGEDLRSVVLADSLMGYCCGAAGTILRTEDGGATWDSLASGTVNDLKGVHFADGSEGWVVGNGGIILHTVNAGSTWTPATSPVTTNLNNICGLGHNLVWACGASGVVVFTQDGSTWQAGSTPVGRALLSISFGDSTNGWACGRNGTVLTSTDGGFTWTDISTGSNTYWDVDFVDGSTGWVAGYVPIGTTEAVLMRTTTGGASWEDQADNVQSGYRNVVATMPGTTDPDEIYIIGGHYDSLSEDRLNYAPGADDDGTGTIAALEAARVLKDYAFEATIKFMSFAAEEIGLYGSDAYARQAFQRGDSIVAVVNFDMIGYADSLPEELEIVHDNPSAWLADEIEAVAGLYVPGLAVRKRFDANAAGSDHWSFWQYGYVAIEGIEDRPLVSPHWHRTTDRVTTLDFDLYTNSVRAGVAVLAEMARLDTTAGSVPAVLASDRWRISPNPCRGGAEILAAVRGGVPVEIEFFDVRGRLVSRVESPAADGSHRVFWQAADLSGRPLSPGVYFARSAGGSRVTKVVLLK